MTKKTKQIISVILAGTIVTSFALSSLQIAKGESLTQTYSDSTNTTNEYINQEMTNSFHDLYSSNSSNENQIDEYLQQVNPTADDIPLNSSINTLSVDENTEEQILDDTYEVPVETNSFRYQNGHNIHPSETNTSSRTTRSTDAVTLRHGENPQRPDGKMPTAHAIDISNYQGDVDWNQVKNSGKADFVILRLGTGWTIHQEGANWVCDTSKGDKRFKEYAASCERLGIPIGGYFFSYADSVEDAKKEAQLALEMLKGVKVDYPIYYDLEDMSTTGTQSPATIAEMAKVFNDTLSAAGYQVGVYANKSWFTSTLNHPYFKTQRQWLAQYNTNSTYNAQYEMWQYTSKGSVPGIYGNVDLNYWYGDAPNSSPKIKAHVNSSQNKITLTLTNATNASNVSFSVYSDVNGNDDLKTYNANKIGLHAYSVVIPISNHNDDRGQYTINAIVNGNNTASAKVTVNNITSNSVTVTPTNDKDGSVNVYINGISSNNPISNISVAVWGEQGGQNDLVWYTAKNVSSNNYMINFKPIDHNLESGTYNIHVYATDNIGFNKNIHVTTYQISNSITPKISAVANYKENSIDVTINTPVDVSSIKLPVWSLNNDQDDLIWYTPTKQNTNTWSISIPLKNHNNDKGKYSIHCYFYHNNKSFLSDSIIITFDNKYQASTQTVDINSGEFKILLDEVYDIDNVSKVTAQVWSDINGKDDIKSYTLNRNNNLYYTNVLPSYHNNDSGKYNIEINVVYSDNTIKNVNLSHNVIIMSLTNLVAKPDSRHENIVISISNLYDVKSVLVPVWSENNGQDDLIWYTAKNDTNGNWSVYVPIRNHNNDTGKYSIHAYYNNSSGQHFLDSTTMSIDALSLNSATTKIIDQKSGKFQVTISGLSSPAGIKIVQIPIWSDKGGQDDIVWYTPKNDGNGNYSLIVDPANHNNDIGMYNIHIYATDTRGVLNAFSANSVNITQVMPATVTANADVTHQNILVNISRLYNVKSVLVPVWSENNGQDDLIWYTAKNNGNGKWSVSVPISNHKNDTGTYSVHAYYNNSSGQHFLGSTTASITDLSLNSVTTNIIDNKSGEFKVTISGLSSPAGIKTVQVPVWSDKDGQDDIIWYTAKNDGNGNYSVIVNPKNHKNESGTYSVHIYATDNRNIQKGLYSTSINVNVQKSSF